MDIYSDQHSSATYADALFGLTKHPDSAPDVLSWIMETLCGPLGDPRQHGHSPVVVLHGDHYRLVRDVVWGREMLPFEDFYETVPKFHVGAYEWSVMDYVRSTDANDLVDVRIVPQGRGRHEILQSRYVDWTTCDSVRQDLYDGFRVGGASPEQARSLAEAVTAPSAD